MLTRAFALEETAHGTTLRGKEENVNVNVNVDGTKTFEIWDLVFVRASSQITSSLLKLIKIHGEIKV